MPAADAVSVPAAAEVAGAAPHPPAAQAPAPAADEAAPDAGPRLPLEVVAHVGEFLPSSSTALLDFSFICKAVHGLLEAHLHRIFPGDPGPVPNLGEALRARILLWEARDWFRHVRHLRLRVDDDGDTDRALFAQVIQNCATATTASITLRGFPPGMVSNDLPVPKITEISAAAAASILPQMLVLPGFAPRKVSIPRVAIELLGWDNLRRCDQEWTAIRTLPSVQDVSLCVIRSDVLANRPPPAHLKILDIRVVLLEKLPDDLDMKRLRAAVRKPGVKVHVAELPAFTEWQPQSITDQVVLFQDIGVTIRQSSRRGYLGGNRG